MTIHVEQCNYKQKQVLKTFKHILSHKVCEMMSIGPIWVHHCRWKCPNCSSNNWVDDIVCSVHQITISELCSNSAAHCQTDAMSDWNCRLFFVPEFLSAMKKQNSKPQNATYVQNINFLYTVHGWYHYSSLQVVTWRLENFDLARNLSIGEGVNKFITLKHWDYLSVLRHLLSSSSSP